MLKKGEGQGLTNWSNMCIPSVDSHGADSVNGGSHIAD